MDPFANRNTEKNTKKPIPIEQEQLIDSEFTGRKEDHRMKEEKRRRESRERRKRFEKDDEKHHEHT